MSFWLYNHFLNTNRGENALKNLYCQKAILFLESEIDLVKLTVLRTNQFHSTNTQPTKSKVYFIPKSNGLGIVGMGEIATSLELSDEFFDEKGNPASLILIASQFEQAFNFSFGGIYKKKSEVFKRKPFNLTKALDYLRNLIIREKRNRDNQKDEKR